MVNTKNREFAFPMVNAVFFNLHLPWFMHGCFGFVFAMVNASNFCTVFLNALLVHNPWFMQVHVTVFVKIAASGDFFFAFFLCVHKPWDMQI